jgi:RNA polymerase sigma factor (sigma-70 family)
MSENQGKNIATVVKDYGRKLFGFIRGKVDSEEEAEDILQDVWYQLSKLTNLDDIRSMSGWLHEVARNRLTDGYRKKKTTLLEDFLYEDEEGEISFGEILAIASDDDPEFAIFRETFWEALMEALQELPEEQRSVFVLNELEDKTLQEIADEQSENLKTIISRKGYAIKHLRYRLRPLYNELLN